METLKGCVLLIILAVLVVAFGQLWKAYPVPTYILMIVVLLGYVAFEGLRAYRKGGLK